MQNQTEPKKHTVKLVIFFIVLLTLIAFFYLNTRSNENRILDSFTQSDELVPHQENGTSNTATNPFDENAPTSSQTAPAKKQLTKEERIAVMTTVIDAATQDIANAKEQLALAKAAGKTTEAAEIQQRLDHMRAVLKRALKKHDDLGLDYPHALFE